MIGVQADQQLAGLGQGLLLDQLRQRGNIGQMIWNVPEVIAQLSKQVTLEAGDLIYTGTPAGVGPVVPGDLITAHIDGLPSLTINVTPPVRPI
jgi:fumarylpyruvate hydrolase